MLTPFDEIRDPTSDLLRVLKIRRSWQLWKCLLTPQMKEPTLHHMDVQEALANRGIALGNLVQKDGSPYNGIGPFHVVEELPDHFDSGHLVLLWFCGCG